LSVLVARLFTGLRKVPTLFFILACVVVLAATYSRSAWIGAFVGVGLIAASKLKHLFSIRSAVLIALAGTTILATGLYVLRDNDFVQNTFFHTDEHSLASTSSNDAHASASLTALKEVVRQPLGRGPGTAGQASVYNAGHDARIAENYYLQVGQEVGWLGLALFIAICILVAIRLYAIRQDPLALGLLAAFIGLVIVNMLSHAWADDTLAYLWWGFAGLVLGAYENDDRHEEA
jgi:O-antigen ligase